MADVEVNPNFSDAKFVVAILTVNYIIDNERLKHTNFMKYKIKRLA
jgi:hypothetical protein